MTTHTLTKQQLKILGMDTLAVGARETLLERIGQAVFDTALSQLLETLNDEQIYSLNYALESCESYEAVFAYLQVTYPGFNSFLKDTQQRFINTSVAHK